ncbi:FadR/GntR family transcriptional regulator [Salinicola rhizosphaerae]|uniref:GntR family transcriptional regulator n=1 Tax=Salinicola rhizosphaerae TaxID=1443141 RepID=A0ABQ3EBM2_9GAMM|nr:FadR/GntR family transcriptional regulator [Salinicola rhizosphaerae]GHB29765.1 GntR family transcriptional regulator [Salinicola rhizosphaerae]
MTTSPVVASNKNFDKVGNPMEQTKPWTVKRISTQESLSRQIAQQLESLITQGRIEVGDKLPTESQLCDMFGVSRTAVREAIAHLKSMGLVETRRGIGTRVLRAAPERPFPVRQISATTVEDILHILELRMTLDSQAAALAASRRDPDDLAAIKAAHADFLAACDSGGQARHEDYAFHRAIVAATHNPFFVSLYDQLNEGTIPRNKLVAGELDAAAVTYYLERVAREHAEVLQAIVSANVDAARDAMYRHLKRAYENYATYQGRSDT